MNLKGWPFEPLDGIIGPEGDGGFDGGGGFPG